MDNYSRYREPRSLFPITSTPSKFSLRKGNKGCMHEVSILMHAISHMSKRKYKCEQTCRDTLGKDQVDGARSYQKLCFNPKV